MKDTHKHDRRREEMLRTIQELEFAALDLNLYLDNFPENQQALTCYNSITARLRQEKERYEKAYGVLTNFGCSQSQCPWSWINDPWPWECGE